MHKLDSIAENVRECQKCELCETRIKAVPGKGNFDADVIFVGEAPGRNEDIHGEPFVGAAGKRLDMILEDTGIDRKDVYITNIVKCRPPKNRVPSKKEEESCNDFIKQEIEIINPKIICVMGNTAYGTLLDGKEITKNHGKIVEKDGRKFFVTFHPAATIYNQKLVEELKEDFRKLAKFLETKDEPKQYEERRCDYCMAKTKHEVVVMPKVVTRKRRWLFKCTECNHERWLQPYRTVAESLY
ncbi:MAG: uracil-DNA glycosylase [Thermoproteota archaeon]|jgi:uracil-DNA glycosylase family 4|nr:uracil-DNA glycosylase [Candidatus Nitrosopelagicus sp.]MEC9436582.1 uracil-DNA glycosylase [Thermoproteota archaeon]GIT55113.1 MAG: uracil-DNA glycosylase [Candidatus Nitrosopelagicus sp.]|tara:strand:- start:1022 stop:1747 length:726 start_codon:yes stop_codon:yes gene_type:complete